MRQSAVYTTCSPLMLITKSVLGGVCNNHSSIRSKDIRFCFLVIMNPQFNHKSALGGVCNNHSSSKDIRLCFLNVCHNPETDVIAILI